VALSEEMRRPARERLPIAVFAGARGLALEAVLFGVVLVAQGVLFVRGLPTPADYDEGVYLAAVDAFRHGQQLGAEIFTAQPPGFYLLLAAGDALVDHSLDGVRTWIIVLALVGCLASYLLGRAFGGPPAGFGAALLLGIAPPYPTFAGRISADLPAFVLGLLALVCVVYAVDRGRVPLFGLAGALFAAAVSVKLSALTVIVPLVAIGLIRRARLQEAVAAAFGTAVVALAVVIASGGAVRDLWFGAVTYHRRARDVPGSGLEENTERVLDFLDPRTPFGWLVPVALVALLLVRPRLRLPLWPLWLWAAVSALLLVWHRPLHDNHLVLLAVTLAVPAGTALGAAAQQLSGRRALLAGAALVLAVAAGYVQESRRLDRNQAPEPVVVADTATLVATLSPNELVVTDRPIIAFLADRRVPGEVIDSAALAFDAGVIDAAKILAAIDRHRIRIVVAAREFRHEPEVLAGLEDRFPTKRRIGDATVYLRTLP
jgi:4-amino-4-deoxy-L-arabinose transferase-like glycosyltransferase